MSELPLQNPEQLYNSPAAMQAFLDDEVEVRHHHLQCLPFNVLGLDRFKTQFLDQPNATAIMRGPMFGAWLESIENVVDAGRKGELSNDETLIRTIRGCRYLGNYALAAALAEGRALETPVQAYDNFVMIPELGRFACSASVGQAIAHTDGTVTINGARFDPQQPSGPRWQPVRHIGPSDVTIPLNDIDPNRHIFRYPVGERLSPERWRQWDDLFKRSVDFIDTTNPQLASIVRSSLTTLIPAAEEPIPHGKSMAATAAFGVISTNAVHDPIRLASHLAFGLRKHMLLAMRGKYQNLFRDGDDPLANKIVRAPSREGLAIAPFLLDDSFINIGLADFFSQIIQHGEPSLHDYAQLSFTRWHAETRQNLTALQASDYATPDAQRLIHVMQQELGKFEPIAQTVPRHIKEIVDQHSLDRQINWRLHTVLPDQAAIYHLRNAWLRGDDCPCVQVPNAIDPRLNAFIHLGERTRYVLTEMSFKEPHLFSQICRGVPMPHTIGAPTPGNIHIAQNNFRAARDYFRQAIYNNPLRPEPWAGFALTFCKEASPQARMFTEQPELVAAVYHAIGDSTIEPEQLAEWLTGRAQSAIGPDCSYTR